MWLIIKRSMPGSIGLAYALEGPSPAQAAPLPPGLELSRDPVHRCRCSCTAAWARPCLQACCSAPGACVRPRWVQKCSAASFLMSTQTGVRQDAVDWDLTPGQGVECVACKPHVSAACSPARSPMLQGQDLLRVLLPMKAHGSSGGASQLEAAAMCLSHALPRL